MNYAYVVSIDLVSIALNISVLNGLYILSCDIHNAYLTAECQEKIWTCGCLEFGYEAGSIMIVRMALYGLNSSGAAFCANLANTLNEIGFLSTKPTLMYGTSLRLNPTALSTTITSRVTSTIYYVYHMTRELC